MRLKLYFKNLKIKATQKYKNHAVQISFSGSRVHSVSRTGSGPGRKGYGIQRLAEGLGAFPHSELGS